MKSNHEKEIKNDYEKVIEDLLPNFENLPLKKMKKGTDICTGRTVECYQGTLLIINQTYKKLKCLNVRKIRFGSFVRVFHKKEHNDLQVITKANHW